MAMEFVVESCECGTPRVAGKHCDGTHCDGKHCEGLGPGAKKACESKVLIDSELAAIAGLEGFPHDQDRIRKLEAESQEALYDSLGVPSLEEIKKLLGVE